MFDCKAWVAQLQQKILDTFGGRVRFLGLQGSFRRGEATEQSDVDLVVILDRLDAADLSAYRACVQEMPEPQRACGFLSGWDTLAAWPKSDLFQFCNDTEPLYGSMEAISVQITRRDALEALRIGCGNLHHGACHSFVFDNPAEALPSLYKSAFFVLQAKAYLETGVYPASRKALEAACTGEDAEILAQRGRKAFPAGELEARYNQLIHWSAKLLEDTKQ